MPSLIRLLVVVGLLGGAAYGAMFALANFVQPKPREMTITIARRLSAVRQLYRFLYAEGNRKDDPAAAIEGPKRGRALPKVLSVGHVDQLLATARKGMEGERAITERIRAARLNCLLEVLYAT